MVGFFEELSTSEVELVQQLKAEVAGVVQVRVCVRGQERARVLSRLCCCCGGLYSAAYWHGNQASLNSASAWALLSRGTSLAGANTPSIIAHRKPPPLRHFLQRHPT
jgi:hypothetical protein